MPFTWLFSQPLVFGAWVVAILVSLTIHEFSHAATALAFGDDTAKAQKRLSLNPLVHIDPLGFILLLTAGFGWAKPVPVNPYNLRPQRLGSAMVSLAGPFSNLIFIILSVLILKIITPALGGANLLVNFVFMLALINLTLFLFNLIPLPPLDGSKVLYAILPARFGEFKEKMERTGPFILFALIIADSFLNIGIF
ncbi:MAG: site-2 protease family protein, partial [Patescibacteria group bacterium]